MSLWKRIFGICETSLPQDGNCWKRVGDRIEIDLQRAPELDQPGQAVRLEGPDPEERVLVLRGSDGKFHAFKNRCSHFGRRLDPVPGKQAVCCCSLGQSTYDYSGNVKSGAAKGNLQVFPVRVDEDRLIIELR